MPATPSPRALVPRIETTLAALWTRVPSVTIGEPAGPPDAFVLISDGEKPFLRLDLHCPPLEYDSARKAEIWKDWIVVGFGCRVVLVSSKDATQRVIPLSDREPPSLFDYFCQIVCEPDALLVASGTRIVRIGADGAVLWKSGDLGVDGVLIHDVDADTVSGDGEWDPPGGWEPYEISLATGALLSGGDPWPK